MPPRSPLFLAAALALLSTSALAQSSPSDPVLDAGRDPRLNRRFTLRSEGMPVSHVIRRLSAKTGVPLTVTGRAGDERLIAFVPDSPLAEVLESIADLYNLKWSREAKEGKISYQLLKPIARVREEAQPNAASVEASLQELDRQANEPPKGPRSERDAPFLVMRSAAIETARANWARIAADGHLEIPLKQLPEPIRRQFFEQAKSFAETIDRDEVDRYRRLRQRYLEEGKKLPKFLEEQPKPAGDPETWRLVFDLKVNQTVELNALLWTDSVGSTLFMGKGAQGDASGITLYKDRKPRPTLPSGQDPPLPNGDPLSKPLFAPNAPPVKPSHLSTPWLNALENLSEMGNVSVYSDDYSNPDPAGKQRQAEPPRNGQTGQDYLDRWCVPRDPGPAAFASPASFWWRRGAAVMIRSRGYLQEAESVIPAALTEQLISHAGKGGRNLLLPDDLLALSALSMPQRNGIISSSAHEGWRRAVEIPARLSPQSRALAVADGLRWDLMAASDQQLAHQLGKSGRSIGPGFAAKVIGRVSSPSSRSRSAISLRLETDLTPGSGYHLSLPAPQLNLQGLIVMNPATARRAQSAGNRLVIAKYYPWYGLETVSGQQRKLQVGPEKVANFAHYPALGPYDSSDETAMRRHVAQMRSAGIEALACYWPGPETFEDKALRKLAPIAKAAGVRLCLMLEDVKRQPVGALATQLTKAVKDLGESYLRVDGNPVVFLRGPTRDQYTHQEWTDLNELLAKTASPGVVLVAEAHSSTDRAIFAGTVINAGISWDEEQTPASIAQNLRARSVESAAEVQRRRRICVAQVTPGVDFRHLSGGMAQIDRINGAFYKSLWGAALDCGADWVLIDSFNQWEIGTEIEPSREYGDFYLKLTAEQAALFKGRK